MVPDRAVPSSSTGCLTRRTSELPTVDDAHRTAPTVLVRPVPASATAAAPSREIRVPPRPARAHRPRRPGRHADPDALRRAPSTGRCAPSSSSAGSASTASSGSSTYRVLEEARWRLGDRLLTHVAGNLLAGDDVLALQQRLLDLGFKVGKVDGRFGHQTEQAVRDFQRNVGVPADGTCGPATLKALARLAPIVRGGSPNAMRAEERIRRDGPQLTGKIVVIDPVASAASTTPPCGCGPTRSPPTWPAASRAGWSPPACRPS